jgi:hypothetical protein
MAQCCGLAGCVGKSILVKLNKNYDLLRACGQNIKNASEKISRGIFKTDMRRAYKRASTVWVGRNDLISNTTALVFLRSSMFNWRKSSCETVRMMPS